SIQNHRITKSYFRTCLIRRSCSQARLCRCTQCAMSDRAERTFELLRYSLGGDRPSQTTHHTRSPTRITCPCSKVKRDRVVFQGWLPPSRREGFTASDRSYTDELIVQCEAIVKVHGVFPSCHGNAASSQRFQFH